MTAHLYLHAHEKFQRAKDECIVSFCLVLILMIAITRTRAPRSAADMELQPGTRPVSNLDILLRTRKPCSTKDSSP